MSNYCVLSNDTENLRGLLRGPNFASVVDGAQSLRGVLAGMPEVTLSDSSQTISGYLSGQPAVVLSNEPGSLSGLLGIPSCQIGDAAQSISGLLSEGSVIYGALSSGAEAITATALPAPVGYATISDAGQIVSAYAYGPSAPTKAVVMNTETMAITEYDNFNFNSFAFFQGQVVAAGPNGLYVLGGTGQAGSPRNSSGSTALADFGSSNLKSIADVIADIEGPGIEIQTVDDSMAVVSDQTALSVEPNEVFTVRVKPGRGIKSRRIGTNFQNVQGGKLNLKDLELRLEILQRKV